MREFGIPINQDEREELITLMKRVFGSGKPKREVTASEFVMEVIPDRVVVKEVEVKWEGERLRVAMTEPDARPPFEWFYEVSSDVGDTDYFKHYLVRADDIVLAQRKVLTPIDGVEAAVLRSDLLAALEAIGA